MTYVLTAWLAMSVDVGLGWSLRAILAGQSREAPRGLR